MVVDLKKINNVKKDAVFQYSYPPTKATSGLPSYDKINPNFVASFKPSKKSTTYQSGFCTNITLAKSSHKLNTSQDAELVLEHSTTSNTKFYVVIPIIMGGTESTQIDNFLSDEGFYLDTDLVNTGKDMICYYDTSNYYVFVFKTPIKIKSTKTLTPLSSNPFNGIKDKNAFAVTNAQNFQEEVQCEYVTKTDSDESTKSGIEAITYISWTFGTIFFVFMIMKFLEIDPNNKYIKYGMLLIGLIFMITFSVLASKKTNKTTTTINYGFLIVWGLIMMALSVKNLKSNPARIGIAP